MSAKAKNIGMWLLCVGIVFGCILWQWSWRPAIVVTVLFVLVTLPALNALLRDLKYRQPERNG